MAEEKEVKVGFLNTTTLVALLAFGLLQALLYIHRQGIYLFPDLVVSKLQVISILVVTVFIVSLFLRLTVKKFSNYFIEPEEKIFFSKVYTWSLYLLGLIFLLFSFGVSLNNLTLMTGLVATGLAFAVRDVLLSFIAWIILLRKKPFRIGDYIRIGDDEGRVIHIGTFYVILDKTPELREDYSRVPNKTFLEKSINNYGKDTVHEQIQFNLKDIPTKNTLEKTKSAISEFIDRKEYLTNYIDMKDGALVFVVKYLVSFEKKQSHRSEVISIVYHNLGKHIAEQER
jgi:MscS family membrane protein